MPAKRRRRNTAAATVGTSPFLRSLSRLPPPLKSLCSASPPPPGPSRPPLRRRRQDEPSSPSSSDEEGSGSLDGEETVQVDFGFFDPKPDDFHGVKLLLRSYLDDRDWDLSGFVDLILQQTTVGTVVKSEDDDEDGDGGDDDGGIYAVVSALNLRRYENCKGIKDVKEFLLGVCPKHVREELQSLLVDQAQNVALLVCERFVNYPDQAVPPLYDGLFNEIEWATEDEPTQEIRDYFHFKYHILITKFYANKHANLQKERNSESDQSIVYIKSEDEIFRKHSSFSFTFDLHSGHVVPPEMKGYKKLGLAMVVKSEQVSIIRQEISLLGS